MHADDQAELIIHDTGIGMNPEELARVLTDPTVRAGTEGELSTGLGLRLCQDLLACQGGTLSISSQLHHGTSVRIQLLAVESQSEMPQAEIVGLKLSV